MSELYTPRNIFNAGKDSYAQQMKNLQGIGKARAKVAKEADDLAFKKKERQFKLEKMKREGAISELDYNARIAQDKEYHKQQNDIQKGKEAQIGVVEQQVRGKADAAKTSMKNAYMSDPDAIADEVRTNRNRRSLSPVFKNGKMSYEVVDQEEESLKREELRLDVRNKRAKANKNDYTRKDVVDLARKFKEEEYLNRDDNDESPAPKIESFMKRAENLLKGGQDSEFDEKTEALITGNIKQYGRSREEVITAMRSKGIIK